MITTIENPSRSLLESFDEVAASRRFRKSSLGHRGVDELAFWIREAEEGSGPTVFLSSGIHGDEPCGPLAIREFLRTTDLPSSVEWVLAPLLNPSGLRAGTRTNAEGIDLNRDFLRRRSWEVNSVIDWWSGRNRWPTLHLSLHEDWEADGFYVYEINSCGAAPLGARVVERLAALFPLQEIGPVDEHELSAPGLILHAPEPDEPEGWPEAIWLSKRAPVLSLTFEAPGTYGTRMRRAGLMAAIAASLEALPQPESRRAA
jgi:protein MpaA